MVHDGTETYVLYKHERLSHLAFLLAKFYIMGIKRGLITYDVKSDWYNYVITAQGIADL